MFGLAKQQVELFFFLFDSSIYKFKNPRKKNQSDEIVPSCMLIERVASLHTTIIVAKTFENGEKLKSSNKSKILSKHNEQRV
jgi:hypothetical protein